MPRITNPIEATGEQVAANIKRLRGSMQYKELSERLATVGRSMTPVAIRDAENGKRRVDVDDLMAFAIVFGVSPLTLLLPNSGSCDVKAHVTGHAGEITCNQIWRWALGEHPLPSARPETMDAMMSRRAQFRERAKPTIDDIKPSDENVTETPMQYAARVFANLTPEQLQAMTDALNADED